MNSFQSCLVLLQLSSLPMAFGYILRLPCTSYGNFSVEKEGYELFGHTLDEFSNLDVKECEYECIQHPLCKSINAKNTSGINCKINSKSTEDQFEVVTVSPSPGWTYKTTNYTDENYGELCEALKPCQKGLTCQDHCQCPGYRCIEKRKTGSGGTALSKTGLTSIAKKGSDWIVFQRHINNNVDFNRNWSEYKNGFGNHDGNFWLGLEKLHQLAAPGKGAILRVDLKHMLTRNMKYAEYRLFEVGDEASNYKLYVGRYSGNAGNSLRHQNAQQFSTYDRDNDRSSKSCAKISKGGWWYQDCFQVNLNNKLPSKRQRPFFEYMSWYLFSRDFGTITFSEMKIKYS